TLDQVNRLSVRQGHRCAACGREAKNMPLNVDHEHFRIRYILMADEITRKRIGWRAEVEFKDGRVFQENGKTKKEAKDAVTRAALPFSVRGLLCAGRYMGCNRQLGRIDDIKKLESFLAYLENPPARQMMEEGAAAQGVV